MTAAVETMAWKNEVPWHGLGVKVKEDMSPEKMLKAAGIDWTVSKRPTFWKPKGDKGKIEIISDKMILARDSDDAYLSMVGKSYKPVQNSEAAEFFKKYCEAGHMNMETMGSLWGGRYIWCLARVKEDFAIGTGKGKDEIQSYLLLCQPHVIGKAMVIQFTPIRVVCWNTLTAALGVNLKGKGRSFRMPHSVQFTDAVKAQAEAALGIAKEQVVEFKEAVQFLAKKKAKAEKVEEYFCEVLKFDPKAKESDRARKKDGEWREPLALPYFRAALVHAPGHDMQSAQGTWWGALNAVTYVVDHDRGRDPGTHLKNIWFAHKADLKRDALHKALDYAKAA